MRRAASAMSHRRDVDDYDDHDVLDDAAADAAAEASAHAARSAAADADADVDDGELIDAAYEAVEEAIGGYGVATESAIIAALRRTN